MKFTTLHFRSSILFVIALVIVLVAQPELAFAAETINPVWQTVEIGEGIKPSFDFGPDDSIHVMGMIDVGQTAIWYAKAASAQSPWTSKTVSTESFYGPGDIRVDQTNTAHMGWHNHGHADPNHATIDAQGAIQIFQIFSPSHNGWDNAIDIDSSGKIHMSSVDPAPFGARYSLEYSVFNGTNWIYEKIENSDSFTYGLNTSIVIDKNLNPHIVYCNALDWVGSGQLRYATRSSETWEISTIVEGANRGRFPSMVQDSLGNLHVVWLDIDEKAETGATTKATVSYAVYRDKEWMVETVAVLAFSQVGFSDARKSVSIAIDSNDVPHVAFADKQTINYSVKKEGAWNSQTILNSDTDLYKSLVVLRLDSNDQPAMVFWQTSNSSSGLIRLVAPKPQGKSPYWILN